MENDESSILFRGQNFPFLRKMAFLKRKRWFIRSHEVHEAVSDLSDKGLDELFVWLGGLVFSFSKFRKVF
jgi:hypothetical protein